MNIIRAFCLIVFLGCTVCSSPGAHIIWITGNTDSSAAPSPDDVGWNWLLLDAGHTVERRVIWNLQFNDAALADLRAADLVIVSRDTNDGLLKDPKAVRRWNCIETPLILLNGFVARDIRWRWTSGTYGSVNVGFAMEVMAPRHGIFADTPLDENNQVMIHKENVNTVYPWEPVNGTLLARGANNWTQWITYWEPGVEFFPGGGQYAGGRRMFLGAGKNKPFPKGEENFHPPGERMFINAVSYMLTEHRVKVTFPGYVKNEVLTHIPLLLELNTNVPNFTYHDFIQTNGYDLRIWNSNQTELLNYEIESWDTNGTSHVWVQVPELVDSNTCIFLSWGLAPHTNLPAYATNGATWSNGYEGVWHLNGTNALDSSAFMRHGVAVGDVGPGVGRIHAGLVFDGTGDVIRLPGFKGVTGTVDRTLSAWIKPVTADAGLAHWGTNQAGRAWTLGLEAGGELRVDVDGGGVDHDVGVVDGQWHHIAAAWQNDGTPDIGDIRLYVDGRYGQGLVNSQHVDTAVGEDVRFGSDLQNRYFQGGLDEVRISSVARSSNWNWAVYQNMVSNQVFNRYEAVLHPGLIPAITNLPATNLTHETAWIRAKLLGDVTEHTVIAYWGATDGGTNLALWSNSIMVGSYQQSAPDISFLATGLMPSSTNFFTFRAMNCQSDVWAAPSSFFVTDGIEGYADLSVVKTVDPSSLIDGTNLVYTIAVSNLGPSTAGGVVVTDTLPSQVRFESSSPIPDNLTNHQLTFVVGSLAVGTDTSITIQVSVSQTAVGTLTNRAFVGTTNQDIHPLNNTAAAETTLPDFDNDGLLDFVDPNDDNDLMSDEEELIANTDPRDPASFLWIQIYQNGLSSIHDLQFPTSTGRTYKIEGSTNLSTGPWIDLRTNIMGDGGMMMIPDTNAQDRMFYRIGVESP